MENEINLKKKFLSDIPREAMLQENHQTVLSPSTSQIQYILSSEDYPLGLKASRPNFKLCDNIVIIDGKRVRMKKRLQRVDPKELLGDDEIREFWRKKDAFGRGSIEEDDTGFVRSLKEKGTSSKSTLRQSPDMNGEDKTDFSLPSVYSNAPAIFDLFHDLDDVKPKVPRRRHKGDKKELEAAPPVMRGKTGSRRKIIKPFYERIDSRSSFKKDKRSNEDISHVAGVESEADETRMMNGLCHRKSWTYIMTMALECIRMRRRSTISFSAVPTNAQIRWRVMTSTLAKTDPDVSAKTARKLENIVAKSYAKKDLYSLSRKGEKAIFWHNALWDDQETDQLVENFREEDRKSSKRKFSTQEEPSKTDLTDKKSSSSVIVTRKVCT